jgi:hypothetical protein
MFNEGIRGEQGRRETIEIGGHMLTVVEKSKGVFEIAEQTYTTAENPNLGIVQWDSEVEDLDKGKSDVSSELGVSTHVRWNDVEIDWDMNTGIKAPSLERLKEALQHITLGAFNQYDV